MRDMKDELKDIYKDFYEGAFDEFLGDDSSKKSAGRTREKYRRDKIDRSADRIKDTIRESASGNSGEQTIESDVVTEIEYANQATENKEEPKEPEKSGMEELNELVGLETIKHDVEELVGLAKVRKMREEKGMKAVPVSLHLVFSGNPGTGKTTVARILAKLYKEIGILTTGQLIETDRSGLVAGYVGQTAIKTQKKIQEAMGGILFIDEAYTLNQEGENFGQEAIDTILKAMEDHRDKFIVIVAGYTELMKAFVESNPGLRSRFNKFFEFPDYTVDELQEIFKMQCSKYQYKLTDEAAEAVREEIIRLEASKGENFANAREVRNLFEKIITNQAARVADLENVDEEMLSTITIEDLKDLEDDTSKGKSDAASIESGAENDLEKKISEITDEAIAGIQGDSTEQKAEGKDEQEGSEPERKREKKRLLRVGF